MGTYDDSKYVQARKEYDCDNARCKISKGDMYLRYALGLKWRVPVCIGCSLKGDKYRCKAVEDAKAAALTPEKV